MKRKLLFLLLSLVLFSANSQTISIVGTGVNGWPGSQIGPEINLTTTDNVTYFIANLAITTGEIKFRQDQSWTTNWGGSTFPSGFGILNSTANIPTTAGTYDVTFNRSNGSYTFITSANFPSIGIWGPAVNSQLGYAAPDVDMTTTDGIHYTLSGFYFSSGNAYFRQDNTSNFVWGSTTYPNGTAVVNGPSLFIPGGEHFVTFNRITGEYSFSFPSVGILGTALNGFTVEDTDLTTTDGFTYTISDLALSVGGVKFRKDNSWAVNWGASTFPNGIGVQDGVNIPINQAAYYSISFNRSTGEYNFYQLLKNPHFEKKSFKVSPNPTKDQWTFSSENEDIESVVIMDISGKVLVSLVPKNTVCQADGSSFKSGVYLARVTTLHSSSTIKILKD